MSRDKYLSFGDHLLALREERRDGQKSQGDTNKDKLKGLVKDLEELDCCLILFTKNTGS